MSDEKIHEPLTDSADLYAACVRQESTAYKILWTYLYRAAFYIVSDQPDAYALAQDCAQDALVRIHERIGECREPQAFRTWARRIVSHIAIDKLRRRKRLVRFDANEPDDISLDVPAENKLDLVDNIVAEQINLSLLRRLLQLAPISGRSRRVVIGRYIDNLRDEALAEAESQQQDHPVRPSHLQVTRSKNLAKLRQWDKLQSFLIG